MKDLFLKLTEYTTPYGDESSLEHLLPSGIQKDSIGNYFIEIGKSETLFTTHLDNFCKEKQKVNHVISGDKISTDGTTILGADNKAGVCVLMHLIEKKVPGTYYFFIGEEPPLSGGLFGSREASEKYAKKFKRFKRAIAFDRKKTGSIITRQAARPCISNEFGNALVKEFQKNGIPMKLDPTGYYTDTASFLDLIPECTNISVGVWNEHNTTEYVQLSYTKKIAEAAQKIQWESLPSVRDISDVAPYVEFQVNKQFFQVIKFIMDTLNYQMISRKGNVVKFDRWFQDDPVYIEFSTTGNSTKINGVDASIHDFIHSNYDKEVIFELIEEKIPELKGVDGVKTLCTIFGVDYDQFLISRNLIEEDGKFYRLNNTENAPDQK